MSWADLDPAIRELAEQELTPLQLEVLTLTLDGIPLRAIAYHLDRSRAAINDRLDAAYRKLRAHGLRFDPQGRPYLQETNSR